MSGTHWLDVQHVTLSYGDVVAVDNVSMHVMPGEVIALTGPSGCGKTSLLRIICGLEDPDAGTIVLRDRVLTDARMSIPTERRRIGLIFQSNALFPHLRVWENIAFGLSGNKQEKKQKAVDMLTTIDMPGLEDRHPHELSGGQQQRVAIARSLVTDPDLLLMDEPFSDLDTATRIELREQVRQILHNAGKAAIIVTHDLDDAAYIAQRTLRMERGQLLGETLSRA